MYEKKNHEHLKLIQVSCYFIFFIVIIDKSRTDTFSKTFNSILIHTYRRRRYDFIQVQVQLLRSRHDVYSNQFYLKLFVFPLYVRLIHTLYRKRAYTDTEQGHNLCASTSSIQGKSMKWREILRLRQQQVVQ